jgi:hypothetical protein
VITKISIGVSILTRQGVKFGGYIAGFP